MSRLGLLLLVGLPVSALPLAAQSDSSPRFEVASVKRNASNARQIMIQVPLTGRVTIINAPLEMIIREAYQLESQTAHHRLVIPSENAALQWDMRFDILAKPPDDAPQGQQHVMLRTLLAERFKLRAHRETRPTPVYALTVARNGQLGPALRPSSVDCATLRADMRKFAEARGLDGQRLCGIRQEGGSIPGQQVIRSAGRIIDLANILNTVMDRPVVDETSLTGTFEWTLTFGSNQAALDAGATRIGTAIQEQLGLRLERKTVAYDVLVIDSVEHPTPD